MRTSAARTTLPIVACGIGAAIGAALVGGWWIFAIVLAVTVALAVHGYLKSMRLLRYWNEISAWAEHTYSSLGERTVALEVIEAPSYLSEDHAELVAIYRNVTDARLKDPNADSDEALRVAEDLWDKLWLGRTPSDDVRGVPSSG